MTDLIDTTEMYLRTILELEEDGQIPMRARISERLGHSGPTVSETVNRMSRDGLVVISDHRALELTVEGRAQATRVMRKHRLAERLLADVIGLEWELVHEEACRWEHVMSEVVEKKILELVSVSDVSPFGNPIPGLDELGVAVSQAEGGVSLPAVLAEIGSAENLILQRIGEPAQIDSDFLADLKSLGLIPGAVINVDHQDGRIFVTAHGYSEGLALDHDLAAHFFVRG